MYLIGLFLIGLVVFLIVRRAQDKKAQKVADAKAAHPSATVTRDSGFAVGGRVTSRAPSIDVEKARSRRENIQRERRLREAEATHRRDSNTTSAAILATAVYTTDDSSYKPEQTSSNSPSSSQDYSGTPSYGGSDSSSSYSSSDSGSSFSGGSD